MENVVTSQWSAIAWVLVIVIASYVSYIIFVRNGSTENFSEERDDDEDTDTERTVTSSRKKKGQQRRRQRRENDDRVAEAYADDQSNKVEKEKENEYAKRIYVMKLFETLLKRSATDHEIDKYASLRSENQILIGVLVDFQLGPSDSTDSSSPSATSVARDQPSPATGGNENKTEIREEDEDGTASNESDDEYNVTTSNNVLPHDASAPAVNSVGIYGSSDNITGYGGKILASKPTPPHRPGGDRVCIDKEVLLKRLKNASTEIDQLFHFVSMY
jgi:hypothetical protein